MQLVGVKGLVQGEGLARLDSGFRRNDGKGNRNGAAPVIPGPAPPSFRRPLPRHPALSPSVIRRLSSVIPAKAGIQSRRARSARVRRSL